MASLSGVPFVGLRSEQRSLQSGGGREIHVVGGAAY